MKQQSRPKFVPGGPGLAVPGHSLRFSQLPQAYLEGVLISSGKSLKVGDSQLPVLA